MKMNKILLTVALLVSVNAFAMDPVTTTPATEAVKEGILARAKHATVDCANYVWSKCPSMPALIKTRLSSSSSWVANHTPEPVKKALTSRAFKIAGAATAVAACVYAAYRLFGHKLVKSTKTATN